ncbi:MAG: RNA polymerase sigma factor [Planctomycetota bacterium]|jgi:RNA polymerase sigma-70 factor (ECF subfamily)
MANTEILHMERLAAGDDAAFELILERYKNRVFGIIYRYIKDRTLAEDLAQEVFIRIYKARNTYEPTAKFSTWVYAITSNLCLNELRKQKTAGRILSLQDVSADGDHERINGIANGKAAAPEEDLERDELAEQVRTVIDELPDQQRMAVILRRYEDLPYQEIAKAMDLSLSAVKSLLSRARENIRKKMTPYVSRQGGIS